MVDQLDVSQYDSAEEAAQRIGDHIKALADELGQKPDLEVTVEDRGDFWVVSWPGGPYEWSMKITGGSPIFAGEPELTGFRDTTGYSVQCKNGSTLSIYPE